MDWTRARLGRFASSAVAVLSSGSAFAQIALALARNWALLIALGVAAALLTLLPPLPQPAVVADASSIAITVAFSERDRRVTLHSARSA